MLKVERFVNQLMTSNCYVVYDEDTRKCLVIDPGSEKSLEEIEFIDSHQLLLDYITITHEHTDHNWGVNALRARYNDALFVCSEVCNRLVKRTNKVYFLFYYDNPDYRYEILPADILIKENDSISWDGHDIHFVMTPGHSQGGMCISIENMLFTGDTIMPFPPYFNGRDSNEDDWKESIARIKSRYLPETVVYPGHGELLTLEEWVNFSNSL